MMKEPPYWQNPLTKEFTVTITSCDKEGEHYLIGISENVVRAAGGGQDGDRGILRVDGATIHFHNTAKHQGQLVLLADNPINPNQTSQLIIDIEWRSGMMQNHTAEHIFVASIKKKDPTYELGYIWIDGNRGVVDIMGPRLDFDIIMETERRVQEIIEQKLPVNIEIVNADELDAEIRAREGVTLKHEHVRIVSVGDFDSSACSGTHVFNTEEIGAFKVIDFRPVEGGTRIEFLTSKNAIKEMRTVYNIALQRKYEHPFEMEQLGIIIDRAKNLTVERDQLVSHLSRIIVEGQNTDLIKDITFWKEYLPGLDMKEARSIIKDYPMDRKLAILFFIPGEKSSLVFWTNELPENASHYISEIVTDLGGRGGGSKDVYTGGFSSSPNPEKIYEEIVSRLHKRLSH
ncbi:MAG: hypothetical protein GF411_01590 [Candidatus Lokiarchaeota archaeon]|nr:hypothetical protein [Candidatus Lokiarchaeota archaeon]